MIVIGICLYGGSSLFDSWSLVLRLIVKLLLIASFPIILYWLHFYESIELERLGQFWTKWRNPLNWHKNLLKIKLD